MKQSDFPSVNLSDSQVPGSSCSLPSEPPDISKWFSSYVYESPEMDSYDNFRGSFDEKQESRKDGPVIEMKDGEGGASFRKRDEELGGKKLCSTPSPLNCSRKSVDKKHGIQYLSKNQDSLHSMSIFSEPLDIRKWFSSYEYESPILDSSDEFRYSVSNESESGKDGFITEESKDDEKEEILAETGKTRNRGEETVVEKVLLKVLVKCNDNIEDNNQEKQTPEDNNQEKQTPDKIDDRAEDNGDLSAQRNIFPERNWEQSLKLRILENLDSNNRNSKSSAAVNSTETNGVKQVAGLFDDRDNGASVGKSISGSNDKENGGRTVSHNGFVMGRKKMFKRANDENSVERPQEDVNQVTAGPDVNNGLIGRNALAERTNIYEHSEVIGKWRCPQKGKPNLGPPLKQLRLERWVRRD